MTAAAAAKGYLEANLSGQSSLTFGVYMMLFTFGPDKLEATKEVIYNPFWHDFIRSFNPIIQSLMRIPFKFMCSYTI